MKKLPCDNLVNNLLLLRCSSSKVDSCCFYALMPHKVGKEGDVVVFLQEVFGKTVTERVRINTVILQ